jgi:hypothetical protein
MLRPKRLRLGPDLDIHPLEMLVPAAHSFVALLPRFFRLDVVLASGKILNALCDPWTLKLLE